MPDGAPQQAPEARVPDANDIEALIQALHRALNELRDASTRVVNSGQLMAQRAEDSQADLGRIVESQAALPKEIKLATAQLELAAARLMAAADALREVPHRLDTTRQKTEEHAKEDAVRFTQLTNQLKDLGRAISRMGRKGTPFIETGQAKHWPYILALIFVIVWAGLYRQGVGFPQPSTQGGQAAALCTPTALEATAQVTGNLPNGDCRVRDYVQSDDNLPANGYLVTAPTNGKLTVEMSSGAFDALLLVHDAQSGRQLCSDDDSAGNRNARCSVSVSAKNGYLVIARAYSSGRGGYTLKSQMSSQPQASKPSPPPSPPEPEPISAGARTCAVETLSLGAGAHAGSLSADDCRMREIFSDKSNDHSFADRYAFSLPQQGMVQIDLSSSAFSPFIALMDSSERQIASNGASGGSNARIRQALMPGAYTIVANTSTTVATTGPYTLQVQVASESGSGSTPTPGLPQCTIAALPLNGALHGSLASTDCRVRQLLRQGDDNSYVDQYRISVPSRGAVEIVMQSGEFDPYLSLYTPQYQRLASDDDGGAGTSARIRTVLQAGEYIVFANVSATTARTGSYALTARFTSE